MMISIPSLLNCIGTLMILRHHGFCTIIFFLNDVCCTDCCTRPNLIFFKKKKTRGSCLRQPMAVKAVVQLV